MPSPCFRAARALPVGTALAGLLSLAGCSLLHWHKAPPAQEPTAAQVAPTPTDTATTPGPQTVTDSLPIAADADSPDTTTVVADVGSELKSTAPKSYVVRRGDTLWGIANMFLRDPWTWPEIWYVNPQIQNPHRIYPGDQLRLALGSNGRTLLQLVRAQAAPIAPVDQTHLRPMLRSAALETPIEAIPNSIIAAFLSHPTVLAMEQIRAAPYIVALPQDHDIAGTGSEVFVKQLSSQAGARYSVLHVDQPLINPDDGRRLGYMAIYTGTAEVTRPGSVTEAVLTDSARETLQGDVLIPEAHDSVADFVPRLPDRPISARIIAVVDNVLLAGQNQVVAINRGMSDGIERGHVLTVDQQVARVPDPCANIDNSSVCTVHPSVTLPTDVAGTLLVFHTFQHMSYALILNDTVPMQVGDRAHAP